MIVLLSLFVITSAIEFGVDLTHEFEEDSPCGFRSTVPLTNQLEGVTFGGHMGILNECGNFGFSARSGDEFIGFNPIGVFSTGEDAGGPFDATFDACCDGGVEFYVGSESGTVSVQGYDDSNNQVYTNSVSNANAWTRIFVPESVKRVVATNTDQTYGIDDLTCFNPGDSCAYCDETMLDEDCPNGDSDCPQPCMRCCKGRGVCEWHPDFMPDITRAKAVSWSFDGFNDVSIPNKPAPINNDPNIYYYILLVGVIAFILINNIFIGCWCLKDKQVSYGKVDMVAGDEV